MQSLVLIAHNIRSAHNIGSLFRTAEGFGVDQLYITGFSPYPSPENDTRLPHISQKLTKQIDKTALGATKTLNWKYENNVNQLLEDLKQQGYLIIGLEQNKNSVSLHDFKAPDKCAVLLGSETDGISPKLLKQCNITVEIKMYGKKESFNVVQAAAICLYALRET